MTPKERARAAATLGQVIGRITRLDRESKRAEYTDTDAVWATLYATRNDARALLRLVLAQEEQRQC